MIVKPWAARIMQDVRRRLPTVAVGDEWLDLPSEGDRIEVKRLEFDDDWPWPMVHYQRRDGAQDLDPRMGAPMFLFGKLAKRGTGARWPR